MRLFLAIFLSITSLFGFIETIETISTDFEQSITNDQNKSIIYKGHMKAKRPNMAFWDYKIPIEKQIFIKNYRVVILEPEIEQAIIKNINVDMDILTIISKATKISDSQYTAHYRDMKFIINLKNNLIKSISYRDTFENSILLTFSNQIINQIIEDKIFDALIPVDFDILRD